MNHTPVLLEEVIRILCPEKGTAFIDATADGGGHLKMIAEKAPKNSEITAIDRDAEMISRLKKRFGKDKRIKFVEGNFKDMGVLARNGKYDGILFDLGLSSQHFEAPEGSLGRGFSFKKDEPLIMTYKSNPDPDDLKAADIVNSWSKKDITSILKNYGEESFASRIAEAIISERKKKRILDSKHLAEIISGVYEKFGKKADKIHPATKTFQAIRMAVNDELGAIESGIRGAYELLKKNGKIAVISFHSVEDRIVKNLFKEFVGRGAKLITKRPITPDDLEVKKNPRARSAKLRAIQK